MTEPARRKPAEAPGRAAPNETLPFRAAPHNLEAEQALLGAMLVNNEAHDRVSSFLEPDHFYDPLHKQIYETASKMIASGKQATPITLKTFFETAEPIDACLTVPQYLGRLAANAATIINARDYGRTIHDLATRRGLIVIGEDVVNAAYDSPVDFPPKEQIGEAQTRLDALERERAEPHQKADMRAEDFAAQYVELVQAAYKRGDSLVGVSTGIHELDVKTGGLGASDLIILAGRPAMGKTSLATNIAFNVARARARSRLEMPDLAASDPAHNGGVVGFFSLEMSGAQITGRALAANAGVPPWDASRGKVTEIDMRNLVLEQQKMRGLPLHIDQSGGLTMAQLASKARHWRRQHGTYVIIVDYLQLLGGSLYRSKNRTQEVTEITSGLKSLAKELNVSIIALAQLSRAVEGRDDKRPQLSDLRESGSIEQDADAVWFVYREEYYLEKQKPDGNNQAEFDDWLRKLTAARNKAEIIIGKQRHGPLGTAVLHFDPVTMTFSDGGTS